jgi:hypothetical protein
VCHSNTLAMMVDAVCVNYYLTILQFSVQLYVHLEYSEDHILLCWRVHLKREQMGENSRSKRKVKVITKMGKHTFNIL